MQKKKSPLEYTHTIPGHYRGSFTRFISVQKLYLISQSSSLNVKGLLKDIFNNESSTYLTISFNIAQIY